jgi:hypothetical protein
MDLVTPELEIIRDQLNGEGVRVTVDQLRELSVKDRVVAEQWAAKSKKQRVSGNAGRLEPLPDVVKRWVSC